VYARRLLIGINGTLAAAPETPAETVHGEIMAPPPPQTREEYFSLAARHVLNEFFVRAYTGPAEYADHDAVYGVERPNHGLCNALRKAFLVPVVADLYHDKQSIGEVDISAGHVFGMQLAMLFEVVGRESDMGYDDDPNQFMEYHQRSHKAFTDFMATIPVQFLPEASCVICSGTNTMSLCNALVP